MSQDYPHRKQPTEFKNEIDAMLEKASQNADKVNNLETTRFSGEERFEDSDRAAMPQELTEGKYVPEGSMEDVAYDVVTDFFSAASEQLENLFSPEIRLEDDSSLQSKGLQYNTGETTEEAEAFRDHFLYDFEDDQKGAVKKWQDGTSRITRQDAPGIFGELSSSKALKAFDELVEEEATAEQVDQYINTESLNKYGILESGESTHEAEELMETVQDFYNEVMDMSRERAEQYRKVMNSSMDNLNRIGVNGNYNALRAQGIDPVRQKEI